MPNLRRARELLDEAEQRVPIVGLAHAKVALDAAVDGPRAPKLAAEQADRRIAALFERECGVPTREAGRNLREARQVLAGVIDSPAGVSMSADELRGEADD